MPCHAMVSFLCSLHSFMFYYFLSAVQDARQSKGLPSWTQYVRSISLKRDFRISKPWRVLRTVHNMQHYYSMKESAWIQCSKEKTFQKLAEAAYTFTNVDFLQMSLGSWCTVRWKCPACKAWRTFVFHRQILNNENG